MGRLVVDELVWEGGELGEAVLLLELEGGATRV